MWFGGLLLILLECHPRGKTNKRNQNHCIESAIVFHSFLHVISLFNARQKGKRQAMKMERGKKGKFNVRKLEWNKSLLCSFTALPRCLLFYFIQAFRHRSPSTILGRLFTAFRSNNIINKSFMGKTNVWNFSISASFAFSFIPCLSVYKIIKSGKWNFSFFHLRLMSERNTWRSNHIDI